MHKTIKALVGAFIVLFALPAVARNIHGWPTGDPAYDIDEIRACIELAQDGDTVLLHYDTETRTGIPGTCDQTSGSNRGTGIQTDWVLRGDPLVPGQTLVNPAGDDIPIEATWGYTWVGTMPIREGVSVESKEITIQGVTGRRGRPLTEITLEHPFDWDYFVTGQENHSAVDATIATTDAVPWYFHGAYVTVRDLHFDRYAGSLEAWYPARFSNLWFTESGYQSIVIMGDSRLAYPDWDGVSDDYGEVVESFIENCVFDDVVNAFAIGASGVTVRNSYFSTPRGTQDGTGFWSGLGCYPLINGLGDVNTSLCREGVFANNTVDSGQSQGGDVASFGPTFWDPFGGIVQDFRISNNTIYWDEGPDVWGVPLGVWSESFCHFFLGEFYPTQVSDFVVDHNTISGQTGHALSINQTGTSPLNNVSRVVVSHNTFENTSPYWWPTVIVNYASDVVLRQNEVANVDGPGIRFYGARDSVVERNQISVSGPGTWLMGDSSGNLIRKNDYSESAFTGRFAECNDLSVAVLLDGATHDNLVHEDGDDLPPGDVCGFFVDYGTDNDVTPACPYAPLALSGTGVEGSVSFDVTFGVSGSFSASVLGLVPPIGQIATVFQDPFSDLGMALGTCTFPPDDGGDGVPDFNFDDPAGGISDCVGITWHVVDVPAGTEYLSLLELADEPDVGHDIDVYVFDSDFGFVGQGATSLASEQVDIPYPGSAHYLVAVHGWNVTDPDGDGILAAQYTFLSWALLPLSEANFTVSGPATVIANEPVSVVANWDSLYPDIMYKGLILFDGIECQPPTVLVVDTH